MAFQYHPFFLITPLWFFAAVHYNSIFRKNKAVGAFLIGMAIVLTIMNLLRVTGVAAWPG